MCVCVCVHIYICIIYIYDSYNSKIREKPSDQRTSTDILKHKIYEWPISTWIDAQSHYSSENIN